MSKTNIQFPNLFFCFYFFFISSLRLFSSHQADSQEINLPKIEDLSEMSIPDLIKEAVKIRESANRNKKKIFSSDLTLTKITELCDGKENYKLFILINIFDYDTIESHFRKKYEYNMEDQVKKKFVEELNNMTLKEIIKAYTIIYTNDFFLNEYFSEIVISLIEKDSKYMKLLLLCRNFIDHRTKRVYSKYQDYDFSDSLNDPNQYLTKYKKILNQYIGTLVNELSSLSIEDIANANFFLPEVSEEIINYISKKSEVDKKKHSILLLNCLTDWEKFWNKDASPNYEAYIKWCQGYKKYWVAYLKQLGLLSENQKEIEEIKKNKEFTIDKNISKEAIQKLTTIELIVGAKNFGDRLSAWVECIVLETKNYKLLLLESKLDFMQADTVRKKFLDFLDTNMTISEICIYSDYFFQFNVGFRDAIKAEIDKSQIKDFKYIKLLLLLKIDPWDKFIEKYNHILNYHIGALVNQLSSLSIEDIANSNFFSSEVSQAIINYISTESEVNKKKHSILLLNCCKPVRNNTNMNKTYNRESFEEYKKHWVEYLKNPSQDQGAKSPEEGQKKEYEKGEYPKDLRNGSSQDQGLESCQAFNEITIKCEEQKEIYCESYKSKTIIFGAAGTVLGGCGLLFPYLNFKNHESLSSLSNFLKRPMSRIGLAVLTLGSLLFTGYSVFKTYLKSKPINEKMKRLLVK